MYNCVAVHLRSESLFDDDHKHIDRNGNPYLGFDGILRGAVEDLDPQALLDSFEKRLILRLPR
jgi:hypothetical protein